MELLHERVHIESDLVLKEFILQSFLSRVVARTLETLFILAIELCHLSHLRTKLVKTDSPEEVIMFNEPGHSHLPWPEP